MYSGYQGPAPTSSTLSAASISTALASRLSTPFGNLVHTVGDDSPNGAPTSSVLPLSKQLEAVFFTNTKVFSAATGIAFHMNEPIYRLVVPLPSTTTAGSRSASQRDDTEEPLSTPLSGGGHVGMLASHRILRTPGRYVFQVGSHVVFEPPTSLCSCAAFKFQVINKHDTRSCKHIIALQMALRLDAELHADSNKHSTPEAFHALREENVSSQDVAPPQSSSRPQWTSIRERKILPEEFIALVTSPHY